MNGGGLSPLAGKVTVWKPLIFHFTLSPTWTVTVLRKKALSSPSGGVPATLPGGPAVTVRVAPCAAAAGTSAVATMAAVAILRVLSKCTPPEIEPVAAVASTAPMTLTGDRRQAWVFRFLRRCGRLSAVLTALVAAALLAPAWAPGLKAANHYADGRPGEVAFAVRTEKDVWGRALDRRVQSASVVKALLLVSYLRQPGRALAGPDQRGAAHPQPDDPALEQPCRLDRGGAPGRGEDRPHRPSRGDAALPPRPRDLGPLADHRARGSRASSSTSTRCSRRATARAGWSCCARWCRTQRWGIGAGRSRPGWTAYFKGGWGSGDRPRRPPGRAAHPRAGARVGGGADRTPTAPTRRGRRRCAACSLRLLRGLAESPPA